MVPSLAVCTFEHHLDASGVGAPRGAHPFLPRRLRRRGVPFLQKARFVMSKRTQGPDAAEAAGAAKDADGAAQKSGPAHELRLGRIKAVIWANPSESGTRYNVT